MLGLIGLHLVFIQPELKCSLYQDKENQVALPNQPQWWGVSGQSWHSGVGGWGRGMQGEARAAAWWLWEMKLLPIPSHQSGALQGALFVSVYLMFSWKSNHLKNGVYFDKNLGRMGSVLNLLEGREINHCFYKNVFTRELEKCKHMLRGGEVFLG